MVNQKTANVIILDNYDSFTWNLYQAFAVMVETVEVYRNDEVSVEEVEAKAPTHLVVGPGPKRPVDAGVSIPAIEFFLGRVPLLGVCLGHQALNEVCGGRTVRSGQVCHGKAAQVHHDGSGIFSGLPNPFAAGRYHSLEADRSCLGSGLRVTARLENGMIMGIEHETSLAFGVQFHPESILSPEGSRLLKNFLGFRKG